MDTSPSKNADTPVTSVVDEVAAKSEYEQLETRQFASSVTPAALRYTPTSRRSTSPTLQPNIFQSFKSPNFQLRIDIPPATRSKFTWANPGRAEEAKFLNLGREPSVHKSSATISMTEMNLVRRIVALPEGDQRAFADGRQLYDLSSYPLVPVCAELNNRDWDLSTFDTSSCCDHVDHKNGKQKATLSPKVASAHVNSVSSGSTPREVKPVATGSSLTLGWT